MFLSINFNSDKRLSCSVSCNCPESADSAGFTWFAHWRLQISTSAALSDFPLCVVTSLLLSAGIKINSSMIPTFKYCQHVHNSFRIYITEGSIFFFFNETAFDNTLKVRNSSLKTDYIGNALWEKVVSSPLRAAVAKLITSPQWQLGIQDGSPATSVTWRCSEASPWCTVKKQTTAISSSRCGCQDFVWPCRSDSLPANRSSCIATSVGTCTWICCSACTYMENLALIRDTLGFRLICSLKL